MKEVYYTITPTALSRTTDLEFGINQDGSTYASKLINNKWEPITYKDDLKPIYELALPPLKLKDKNFHSNSPSDKLISKSIRFSSFLKYSDFYLEHYITKDLLNNCKEEMKTSLQAQFAEAKNVKTADISFNIAQAKNLEIKFKNNNGELENLDRSKLNDGQKSVLNNLEPFILEYMNIRYKEAIQKQSVTTFKLEDLAINLADVITNFDTIYQSCLDKKDLLKSS